MNVFSKNTKAVLLGGFILLFALLSHETAQGQILTSIDVTPANPTIYVGQTQHFTAIGGFSDGSSAVLGAVTGIASGWRHTCAVLSDGTVWCWGNNDQDSIGATPSSSTPVMVNGIFNAMAIATGSDHTCVVLSDGTVNCWGYNGAGQLGDGTTTASSTPVLVSGISTATAVSVGEIHTCAVLSNGTVKCWGG